MGFLSELKGRRSAHEDPPSGKGEVEGVFLINPTDEEMGLISFLFIRPVLSAFTGAIRESQ
jgi:hypothetical protein